MERTAATLEIPQLHEKLVDSSANLHCKVQILKANEKIIIVWFCCFAVFWSQMEKKSIFPTKEILCSYSF